MIYSAVQTRASPRSTQVALGLLSNILHSLPLMIEATAAKKPYPNGSRHRRCRHRKGGGVAKTQHRCLRRAAASTTTVVSIWTHHSLYIYYERICTVVNTNHSTANIIRRVYTLYIPCISIPVTLLLPLKMELISYRV